MDEARERTTVMSAAEIAEAMIKTAARIESMMSFFLFFLGGIECGGFC